MVIDSLHGLDGPRQPVPHRGPARRRRRPLEAIVADVIDRRDRTRLFGALDTLEYLKQGGRIGNAQALLGSMLSIKPVIEVRDGVVEESGKVRTRSKALRAARRPACEGQPVEHLCGAPRQAPDIDELLELLEPLSSRDEIVIGTIGPVIGTHAGPRVIGVEVPGRPLTSRARNPP